MIESGLLSWLGTVVAGGGVGAAITYLATFKSNKRKAIADAKTHEELAEQATIESEEKMGKMET